MFILFIVSFFGKELRLFKIQVEKLSPPLMYALYIVLLFEL